jgi:plasmid stabilization system protein ParE
MTRRFIVRPLAEADVEDAVRWYKDEQAGLAERFLTDVDRTFARIRERLQFPAVSGGVRRALLHAFPYAVYFRVLDEIVIDGL